MHEQLLKCVNNLNSCDKDKANIIFIERHSYILDKMFFFLKYIILNI